MAIHSKTLHDKDALTECSEPSVSAQNDGIEQMATLLRDDLQALGFRIIPARCQRTVLSSNKQRRKIRNTRRKRS